MNVYESDNCKKVVLNMWRGKYNFVCNSIMSEWIYLMLIK